MNDIPQGALEALLREDGIEIPTKGGAEKPIRCFLPNHGDDKTPSMSINVVKGTYYCHKENLGGNAWTYLKDVRGYDTERIKDKLAEFGWDGRRIDALHNQQSEYEQYRKGLPKSTDEPYNNMKGRRAVMTHDYHDGAGKLICRIMRYETKQGQKGPKVLPFTPRSEGGWWVTGPLSDNLPPDDQRVKKTPLYRLPEMMDKLAKMPGRQVWIVEGEKCVDAVLGIKDGIGRHGPPPCTTGMFNFDPDKVDFAPLEGKKVLLMADQDDVGHSKMLKLAKYLAGELGCAVRMFLPPGNAAPRFAGFDVADAIAEGGWPAVIKWVKEVGEPTTYKMAEKNKAEDEIIHVDGLEDTDYFRILGLSGQENIAIQSKTTHEIHLVSRRSLHNEGCLLMMAPLAYWLGQSKGQGFGKTPRLSFADGILRTAEKKGHVNVMTETIARGAAQKNGTVCFNLGDKVLFPGPDGRLSIEKDLDKAEGGFFQPGPRIPVSDHSNAAIWARDLYETVMQYRWQNEMDGRAFMGWMVSSIVGGALDFRPMLWLIAPPSTGKTFLLEKVMARALDTLILPLSETTEAGLISTIASDSLPCYLDEFEPRRGEEGRWSKILDLIRVSTGGDGARLRGTAGNTTSIMHRPRFSILVASTMRPTLSTADDSRFFTIRLSGVPVENWPKVRKGIEEATKPYRTTAIRAHIIRNTMSILDKAKSLEDDLARTDSKLTTREIKTIAALTAGAGFFSGDYNLVQRRTGTRDDTYSILNLMLSSTVRTPGGEDMTLAEVIRIAHWDFGNGKTFNPTGWNVPFMQLAGRYGFRMGSEETLWVATGLREQNELMRRTEYENVDLHDYFRRLPGAKRVETSKGSARRIRFAGIQKTAIQIGGDILEQIGFAPSRIIFNDDDMLPPPQEYQHDEEAF